MIKTFVGLAILFFTLRAFSQTSPSELHLNVSDVRSDVGQILISVSKESDRFPKPDGNVVKVMKIPAKKGSMSILISDLAPGEYALALHHDENGDEKMDYNFVGMPKEGFGFSNNPKIYFGAPKFKTARFQMNAPVTSAGVKVKYF